MMFSKNLHNSYHGFSFVKLLPPGGFLFISFLGMFFAGIVMPGVSAQAASTSTKMAIPPVANVGNGPSCVPDPTLFAQIKAIQNNSALGPLEEIKSELVLRKQLLTQTIVCAEQEAQTLKASLAATIPDPSFSNLQLQLSSRLDEAVSYYRFELGKVSTAGLGGNQAIAKEVLAWRETNYAPLSANISNFILWSGNQTVFDTAEKRLGEVGNLVGSVPFSKNSELQGDFQAAAVSLRSAESENVQAKQALAESLPSDQSLALIQQSLSDLSLTYQHFFDISNLVEKLLPH
jgi:hypothetical protein